MGVKDYDDRSTRLVLDTPSGLPENIRHALNVLGALGIKDDATFLALVNDTLMADPLHLCRMVRKGSLRDVPGLNLKKAMILGSAMHIPSGDYTGSLPNHTVVISLTSNNISVVYLDTKTSLHPGVGLGQIWNHELMELIKECADSNDANGHLRAIERILAELSAMATSCFTAQKNLIKYSLKEAVQKRMQVTATKG